MQTLFELATGEKLTIESLSYYLPLLQKYQQQQLPDAESNQIIIAPSIDDSHPDFLIKALSTHLNTLKHAIYRKHRAPETMSLRKEEIDREIAWFVYDDIPDGIVNVKSNKACAVLGVTNADILILLQEQLSWTSDDLGNKFGDGSTVAIVLCTVGSAEALFAVDFQFDFDQDAINLAKDWVNKRLHIALSPHRNNREEAFQLALHRALAMHDFATLLGNGNSAYINYACEQIKYHESLMY